MESQWKWKTPTRWPKWLPISCVLSWFCRDRAALKWTEFSACAPHSLSNALNSFLCFYTGRYQGRDLKRSFFLVVTTCLQPFWHRICGVFFPPTHSPTLWTSTGCPMTPISSDPHYCGWCQCHRLQAQPHKTALILDANHKSRPLTLLSDLL